LFDIFWIVRNEIWLHFFWKERWSRHFATLSEKSPAIRLDLEIQWSSVCFAEIFTRIRNQTFWRIVACQIREYTFPYILMELSRTYVFFVFIFSYWLDFSAGQLAVCAKAIIYSTSHLRSVGHSVVVYRFPTFLYAFVHFLHHFHDPIISY
jgi:hypothetical protein